MKNLKQKIIIAAMTLGLTLVGLSSDLAKDVAVKIYCSVQPHDCEK